MKAKRNLWIYSLLALTFIGASIVIYINYKSPNNSKATLISVAAQGDEAKVKLLITNGAQINATDSQGRTALMTASSKGNTAIVKLLLEQGADTNLKDNKGQTAFTRASDKRHQDIMKLLDPAKPTGSAPINPDAATFVQFLYKTLSGGRHTLPCSLGEVRGAGQDC